MDTFATVAVSIIELLPAELCWMVCVCACALFHSLKQQSWTGKAFKSKPGQSRHMDFRALENMPLNPEMLASEGKTSKRNSCRMQEKCTTHIV